MGIGNFFESKILALTCLILALDTLVLIASSFLPYWFKLHITPEDATYGTEGRRENYVIQSGLFFIADGYNDIAFMTKMSNHFFAPKSLIAGQLLFFAGTVGIATCTVAGFILACRSLGSMVGEFFLAGLLTFSSVCVIVGVVVSLFVFIGLDDNVWINLPMDNPDRLAAYVTPDSVEIDWAFFIAIIGAVLSIVAVFMIWIEAKKTCRYVEDIRQKQLRDPHYGAKEDIPYTKFNYVQSYPESYSVTVPVARPPQQTYYGEPSGRQPQQSYVEPQQTYGEEPYARSTKQKYYDDEPSRTIQVTHDVEVIRHGEPAVQISQQVEI